MTGITYRTAGDWGPGKGGPLAPDEIDANFHSLSQRIDAIDTGDTITAIDYANNAITITTASGGVFGPFTLPKAMLRPRGEWAAATAYALDDLVVVTGDGLYLVNIGHTSDATFDANKLIGGNLVYWKLMDQLAGAPGADGAAAEPWTPGAIGPYVNISNYSSEAAGFSYLSIDGDGGYTTELAVVFFKKANGAWDMVPFQGPAGSGAATAPIVSGYASGTFADGQKVFQTVSTGYYVPGDLTAANAVATLDVAPTSAVEFRILVGSTFAGSIFFNAGSTTGYFGTNSDVIANSGAIISIYAPSTHDDTAAGLTFAIPMSLSTSSGGGVYTG